MGWHNVCVCVSQEKLFVISTRLAGVFAHHILLPPPHIARHHIQIRCLCAFIHFYELNLLWGAYVCVCVCVYRRHLNIGKTWDLLQQTKLPNLVLRNNFQMNCITPNQIECFVETKFKVAENSAVERFHCICTSTLYTECSKMLHMPHNLGFSA